MNLQVMQDGFAWLLSSAGRVSPPREGVSAQILN